MDQREAPFFGALHTLAVTDGDRRTGFTAGAFAGLDVEGMMDTRQRPVPVQQFEIIVDRGFRREVLGKRTPLAAGREHVEDRVQDLAHLHRARPPAALGGLEPGARSTPTPHRSDRSVNAARPVRRPAGSRSSTSRTLLLRFGCSTMNHIRFHRLNNFPNGHLDK